MKASFFYRATDMCFIELFNSVVNKLGHMRCLSGMMKDEDSRWGQTTPQMGHEMSRFLVNF